MRLDPRLFQNLDDPNVGKAPGGSAAQRQAQAGVRRTGCAAGGAAASVGMPRSGSERSVTVRSATLRSVTTGAGALLGLVAVGTEGRVAQPATNSSARPVMNHFI